MARKSWGLLALAGVLAMVVIIVAIASADEEKGKGFLGVVLSEVTSDIAADYGVKAGEGVLVEGVTPGSPADDAGLRENDVIVRINKVTPTGPEEFRKQVEKYKADDTVELVYLRGGKEKTIQVKLAARKPDRMDWAPGPRGERRLRLEGPPWEWHRDMEGEKMAYAGIVTQTMSEGLTQYFKVEKGVLISEVMKDSPAERAGLKAGDVILRIGDKAVEDESDVREAIRDHKPGDAADFQISRDGKQQTVKVTLGEQIGYEHIDRHMLGLGPEGSVKVVLPDEAEMEKLKQELENLKIEIEAMPDIDIDLKGLEGLKELERLKDLDVRGVRVQVNGVSEPIQLKEEQQNQSPHPQRFRDRLTDAFQRLNRQVNRLMERAFV